MSLTDEPPAWTVEPPDEWGDGPAAHAPGEAPTSYGGGRTPPQDMAAEQSVLGAMLISKDAIADVVEVVRGPDYYRPAHEDIHDAILDLYGRGEPADMVTVAGELQRRGVLQKIGGAPYLHTLAANVPIAANAGFYAEIVREKAILRRLVDAGTKIVQISYAGEGEVEGIVNEAQAEIYKVTDRRKAEDYAPLGDIMDGVLDEIEAIENREAGIYGVPTGFADLDELTNGLHAGQMIVVAARPAMGKALALDTPLPTPTGWTTMGEVRVGDQLYDAQGRPTTVVAATDVLVDRPCYEVEFSDGSTIVADAQHQWLTNALGGAGRAVRTTEQLARSLHEVHTIALPPADQDVPAAPGAPERQERPARDVKITDIRAVASVPVRCVQVDNDDHLYLAGRSMIPTHNSTLALDLCRAASVHNNLTSAFFSLEMTRAEIVMRLLSAEAKIPLNHIRNGRMGTEEWDRLARHVAKVSAAPMFIDDSPNMTMTEIRAKARRLKQKHDLKLMVIDYLQLMTSGKKVESRQLEVSEFSRQMKLLAKELEVPVIALSQLNRGPEQRSDKRPMMSDLRESGCLTADTRLLCADTNAEVTLGELMETGAKDVPVWALDERLKLVPRTLTHAFPSGTKPVFEVTLTSGRRVRATANHPFLTYEGWMPLAELTEGSRVGSIRHVPPPLQITPRDPNEIVLLGHLIGDGSFVKRQPIHYASIDEHNLQTVAWAARQLFGIEAVRDEYPAARVTTLCLPAPYRLTHGRRNPIAVWLDEMGLFGLRSHEKFVPDWVFSLPKEQVALFLRSLWATDGCIHLDRTQRKGTVYYGSTSRRLADDVARLLGRFNVFTRITTTSKTGYRPCYQVHVSGADNQLRFLDDIGASGAREDKAIALADLLRTVNAKPGKDTVPTQVWADVRARMSSDPVAAAEVIREHGSLATLTRGAPSRSKLFHLAALLGDNDLALVATNDVYWDEIKTVECVGELPVFDATVLGVHNFVANGIPLHNSIEQDADMVILLHRDDVYEKESTRPGEADLIVAKHRNGATRDIVVAFQGHYSRFIDMAH